jgi:DHA3 family macrolide efflux protein-like MFS transporter
MEAVWGVGVVVGGVTLSAWGGFRRRVVTSFVGLILLGSAMAVVGFIPATGFWIAVGMLFIVGFTNPIINGPLFAVVQSVVAPDMQGRVFTLILSAASAMSPLGLIIAGPVADSFGVQSWFIVGGVITALLGVVAFFIPAVMNIEDGRDGSEQDAVDTQRADGPQRDEGAPLPKDAQREEMPALAVSTVEPGSD